MRVSPGACVAPHPHAVSTANPPWDPRVLSIAQNTAALSEHVVNHFHSLPGRISMDEIRFVLLPGPNLKGT